MLRICASALFLLMVFIPVRGYGQTSCLPSYTALQSEWLAGGSDSKSFASPILIEKSGKLSPSRVLFVGETIGGAVKMSVKFDPKFDGVSLPYNLYAVLIVRDGEPAAWWDFTSGCTGPGISFFPGQEIHLPKLKLIGADPERLQIMVWGRL